jgi:hypothetical protein
VWSTASFLILAKETNGLSWIWLRGIVVGGTRVAIQISKTLEVKNQHIALLSIQLQHQLMLEMQLMQYRFLVRV